MMICIWKITVGVEHNGSLSPREERITQKTYFKLGSKNDRELDEFISVAQIITDLLCFTINETVALDSMSATSNRVVRNIEEDKTEPIPINIYNPSRAYPKNSPNINPYDMLFGFSDIQNDPEQMIKEWIKNRKLYSHAFNLYFSAQLEPQLSWESKFLSLAQGLEVYHRKKFDGEEMDIVEFDELVQLLIEICPVERRDWLKKELENSNEVSLGKRMREIINHLEGFSEMRDNGASWHIR